MAIFAIFETKEKLWVSTEAYRRADLKYSIRFKFWLSQTKPDAKMSLLELFFLVFKPIEVEQS